MNSILSGAIAAELALLAREVDTPVAPFGFGVDLHCTQDLDELMPEVDDPQTVLAQALARRLDCPRGALADDRNYGIDLREYLNRGLTTDEIRSLAGTVRSELTKDDRVDTVRVIVTPSSIGDALRLSLSIAPRDSVAGGPFELILAVTDGGIHVEELRR